MKIELKKQKMQKKLNKLENAWNRIDYFLDDILNSDVVGMVYLVGCFAIGTPLAFLAAAWYASLGVGGVIAVGLSGFLGLGIIASLTRWGLIFINKIIEKRYDKIESRLNKLKAISNDPEKIKIDKQDSSILEKEQEIKDYLVEIKEKKKDIKVKEKLVRKLIKLKKSQNKKDEKIELIEQQLEEYQEFNV